MLLDAGLPEMVPLSPKRGLLLRALGLTGVPSRAVAVSRLVAGDDERMNDDGMDCGGEAMGLSEESAMMKRKVCG